MTDLALTPTARLDAAAYRRALGGFASGIAIITADAASPIGMTCQSFFSLSLDPPLIAFAVSEGSQTYPGIKARGSFCVNVLAESQEWLSRQFSRKDSDRWHGVSWEPSPLGNPIIDGSLLWIDCSLEDEHLTGDHVLAVGRVRDVRLEQPGTTPLLYFLGRYSSVAAS